MARNTVKKKAVVDQDAVKFTGSEESFADLQGLLAIVPGFSAQYRTKSDDASVLQLFKGYGTSVQYVHVGDWVVRDGHNFDVLTQTQFDEQYTVSGSNSGGNLG